MNYINLSNLLSVMIEFCRRHSFVNSVTLANETDFRNTPNLNYPLVNIEPVEAPISGNRVSQGFVITVADLLNTEFEDTFKYRIIDECQRIAQDIITFLQNEEMFEASTNITLLPFEDEGTDRTAGVVFRINLTYDISNNVCVFDDLVDIVRPFCINEELRTVSFFKWLMYPYLDQYEVTFDGGVTWSTMDKLIYDISDESIPAKTIGQRLKFGLSHSPSIVWNAEEIKAKE